MRNSLNFKIYKLLLKCSPYTKAYDPFVKDEIKNKYGILEKIDKKNNYDAILFLSKSQKFNQEFKKLISKKNNLKIIDPFEYYN